jgi:hypothetical protein
MVSRSISRCYYDHLLLLSITICIHLNIDPKATTEIHDL